jgi:hypothetical protein
MNDWGMPYNENLFCSTPFEFYFWFFVVVGIGIFLLLWGLAQWGDGKEEETLSSLFKKQQEEKVVLPLPPIKVDKPLFGDNQCLEFQKWMKERREKNVKNSASITT